MEWLMERPLDALAFFGGIIYVIGAVLLALPLYRRTVSDDDKMHTKFYDHYLIWRTALMWPTYPLYHAWKRW